MKKIILFKIGSKNAQLPKMIGAFLIVISILMLIQSGGAMYSSWQALKEYDYCVGSSGILEFGTAYNPHGSVSLNNLLAEMKFDSCRDTLYQQTGVQVSGGQTKIDFWNSRQFWMALLAPISAFFGWIIIFLFALFLFNSASIVVPVEQIEIPIATEKRTVKKKKK